jgi:hypothetical protein
VVEATGIAYLELVARGAPALERSVARQAWQAAVDTLIAAVRALEQRQP